MQTWPHVHGLVEGMHYVTVGNPGGTATHSGLEPMESTQGSRLVLVRPTGAIVYHRQRCVILAGY